MVRDIRVSFKMNEEKKDDLQAYADSYGVTMSALCALIVGQWLHNQNQVINPLVESVGQVVQQQLQQQNAIESGISVAEMIKRKQSE